MQDDEYGNEFLKLQAVWLREESLIREANEMARRHAEETARRQADAARLQAEETARRQAEETARRQAEETARRQAEETARRMRHTPFPAHATCERATCTCHMPSAHFGCATPCDGR